MSAPCRDRDGDAQSPVTTAKYVSLAIGKIMRTSHSAMSNDEDYVPITGVVDVGTSLGVFLVVEKLRVFIPANVTSTPSRVYRHGETVTIEVLRRYAQSMGFIT